MSPKRGDRVAPPPMPNIEWDLRFASNEAARGWDDLCQQAPSNTLNAWHELRGRSADLAPTSRHHQLKGRLATAVHRGIEMEQWQFEVTGNGRIWYVVDSERHTLWIRLASCGHPKATD
ncbi:MAG: hypothetical protein GX542_12135 [Rhodococcus sp.]|nr:hypothetical protein [Rhodococcus sp. (in: high G+C Gram-positive bacteria)]